MKQELLPCPMRNQKNGNCSPLGGFCQSGTEICKAAQRAYDTGYFDGIRRRTQHSPTTGQEEEF